MEKIRKVVVIGCSGAGALAGRMIKSLEPSIDVTIIREEEEQGLLTRCATLSPRSINRMETANEPRRKTELCKSVTLRAVTCSRSISASWKPRARTVRGSG